jgi:ParB family chromosome partitioning protein
MSHGHIELNRSVASIHVGFRFRQDLGDVDELAASIAQMGLLQPITISPDGVLICGVRRYAAVVKLGWKTVNVWVRSGISTALEQVLAEQHENTLRKGFTPTESARLYNELMPIFREDAARRLATTQFGFESKNPEIAGSAKFAGPRGSARDQAARAVTGRRSDLTLERVLEVQRLAGNPEVAPKVRDTAVHALEAMDRDGRVNGHYQTVKAAESVHVLERLAHDDTESADVRAAATFGLRQISAIDNPAQTAAAAKEAIARAHAARDQARITGVAAVRHAPASLAQYSMRAFLMILQETDFWWLRFDPAEVGAVLTPAQWDHFSDWVDHAVAFREAAKNAAPTPSSTPNSAGGAFDAPHR